MNFLFILVGSFLTALSGALAPGPLLTVTVAESVRRGFSAGPLLISGHAMLEMGITMFLLSGLSAFLKIDSVMVVTGIAGSLVLLYMGITTLKSASNFSMQVLSDGANASLDSRQTGSLILKGAIVSLSNPYWLIWWLTIGGAFLSRVVVHGYLYVFAFFIGHILADYLWYSIISTTIHFGKEKADIRLMKAIYIFCGAFLLLLALYFGYDSIRRII